MPSLRILPRHSELNYLVLIAQEQDCMNLHSALEKGSTSYYFPNSVHYVTFIHNLCHLNAYTEHNFGRVAS